MFYRSQLVRRFDKNVEIVHSKSVKNVIDGVFTKLFHVSRRLRNQFWDSSSNASYLENGFQYKTILFRATYYMALIEI